MRLVPQARILAGDDRAVQGSIEVSQLFEAITQALRIMFRGDTGVLVVDDLQWADSQSIVWLSYAIHRLGTGVLTVVSRRSTEAAPPETTQLISDARRGGQLIDLPMSPLEASALDDLLSFGIRDVKRRSELSRNLHAITGGLPLFVIETLRSLLRAGQLDVDDQDGWHIDQIALRVEGRVGMPGNALREFIWSRISRLEAEVPNGFWAVCVAGT